MKYKILIISLLSASVTFANDIKIKEAKGEWPVTNITPEQATEKALTEAKFDALRQAGVAESVNSIESMFTSNSDHFYTGSVNLELRGEVIDFEILEKKIELVQYNGYDNLIAKVTIKATVREYKKNRDDAFQIRIEGIESVYKENDALTFHFTPSQAGYLKIFYFENNNSGSLLFPNDYEKNRLFEANQTVPFPTAKGIDYQLSKLDNKLTVENNLFIFVYTKEDVPFYEKEVDFHSVLSWIAKISPDKRTEVRALIQISKKK